MRNLFLLFVIFVGCVSAEQSAERERNRIAREAEVSAEYEGKTISKVEGVDYWTNKMVIHFTDGTTMVVKANKWTFDVEHGE